MRKVLSFVLILALVLSSFSMAFAADVEANKVSLSDIDGLTCEGAVNVLVALGIVEGYPDGTYKPDQVVNRAEAAKMIIVALGLEDSVGTQISGFTDMSGYGWAEGYVAYAAQLGIIEGYGDGTFQPGKTVSYDEFVTMVVRALGYRASVLAGVWPANFSNQGTALGLFDKIVSGGSNGMNRADVAVMMYNALPCEIGAVGADGKWVATVKKYDANGNPDVFDSMLFRNDAYAIEYTMIDDGFAEDSLINLRGNIGQLWQAFFLDDDDQNDPIIALKSHKADTLPGKWVDGGAKWKSGGVEYVYNTSDDTVSFFWNGEATGSWVYNETLTSGASLDIKIMEAKLTGKNIREQYSLSVWDPSVQAIVEAGDMEDLEDGELLGEEFDLAKDDSIIENSFELIGVDSLEDIKADNVVYVYPGIDSEKIRRVAVGTEIIEGKITKVNMDDSEWTINGTVYGFTTDPATEFDDLLGDTVKLWMDAYGDIYDYDVISGQAKDYAVVKAITNHNTASVDYGTMKLYLADDSTKTFTSDLSDDCISSIAAGSLIGYSLDKDGVIDAMFPDYDEYADGNATYMASNYLVTGANVTLASTRVMQTNKKAANDLVGVGNLVIDSDVVVFTYDDEGGYDVSNIDNLTDEEVMVNTDYLVRDGEVVAMLVDEQYATGKKAIYAVFNVNTNGSNYVRAYNNVDEKAYEMAGFVDGVKTSSIFTSDDSTGKLSELARAGSSPAAYEVKIDADGNISKIKYLTSVTNFAYTGDPINSSTYRNYIEKSTTEVYAIAADAQIYEFYVDGSAYKYKTYNGRIETGANIWVYDADDDVSAYEIVIIERP